MNWSEELDLIKLSQTADGEGYHKKARVTRRRKVFCNVKTATRQEFYTAKQAGVNIARTFEVQGVDYDGERVVEYTPRGKTKAERYTVERDYSSNGGETYELNCSITASPRTVTNRRA